jgi:hypothetical protein
MHPLVASEIGKARAAELRARASEARAVRRARAGTRPTPSDRRVRAAVGFRLVSLGLRLAGEPRTDW